VPDRSAVEPRRSSPVPDRPRHAASTETRSTTPRVHPGGEVQRYVVPAAPYGPGSALPLHDGAAPGGFSIKGNEATKLYHPRDSRYFTRARADVWFDTEAAAEAAGFLRWDRRGTAAHEALQTGPATPPGSSPDAS
jgi:hypothetical protein